MLINIKYLQYVLHNKLENAKMESNTQLGTTAKLLVPDILKDKNLSFIKIFRNSIKK